MKRGAEASDGLVPDPNHDTVINISSDEYEDDDIVDDADSKEDSPKERNTYVEADLKAESFRAQSGFSFAPFVDSAADRFHCHDSSSSYPKPWQ